MNELLYFLDNNFWWALIISFFVALFFYYFAKVTISDEDTTVTETDNEKLKKYTEQTIKLREELKKREEIKKKETERLIKEGKISARRVKLGNAISKGSQIGCGCMIWLIFILSSIIFILTLVTITFDSSSEIDDYIKERDFGKAHEYLDKMKSDDYLSERENSFWSFLIGDDGPYVASEYLIKKFELLDAETSYLLNLGDEESLNRIISVMYNFNLDYSPHIGEFESMNTQSREYRVNKRCEDEIMRYNRKCDVLLNKAINIKNLDFAKAIISLYKENLLIERKDFRLFGKNTYNITLSKKDIDNAKEKLNEAIKEGVFGKNKTSVK